MERKHYAGINPGLQLVEKAGLLAKTGQGARDAAYLSLAGTWLQDRAHHLHPPPSSNCSNHFSSALIKGLAPSGCCFLSPEPATGGRFFFSGIAGKSRMTNLQVPTTGRKTLQREILGAAPALEPNGRRSWATGAQQHPTLARRRLGAQGKQTNLGALPPRQVGSSPPAFPGYRLPRGPHRTDSPGRQGHLLQTSSISLSPPPPWC